MHWCTEHERSSIIYRENQSKSHTQLLLPSPPKGPPSFWLTSTTSIFYGRQSFSSIGKVKIGFSEEEYLGPCHKIVPNAYIFSFRFMTTALKWKIPGSFYCILTLPNVLFIKRHSSWKILEKASCISLFQKPLLSIFPLPYTPMPTFPIINQPTLLFTDLEDIMDLHNVDQLSA